MVTLAEIEAKAMDLTDSERAALASHLLQSLPPLLDEDDGVAVALRRDAEMDANPAVCMTYQGFKEGDFRKLHIAYD